MSEDVKADDLHREIAKGLHALIEDAEKNEKELIKQSREEELQADKLNPQLKPIFLTRALLKTHLAILHAMIGAVCNNILAINHILHDVPTNDNINELKHKLEEQNKKVVETLLPLKQIIDEAKERAEHGDDIYG